MTLGAFLRRPFKFSAIKKQVLSIPLYKITILDRRKALSVAYIFRKVNLKASSLAALGAVFDVAVDVDPISATFGQYVDIVLTEIIISWVPPG